MVTEYGLAFIHGKSLKERAKALIAIADAKFREWLNSERAKKIFLALYHSRDLISFI
jgi:4-hydroxybutyrate CoA-transferase